jgi:citrate synthase
MLWLLLTGEIPSESQVRALSRQLAEQGQLPSHIEKLIDSFVAIYENSQLLICVPAKASENIASDDSDVDGGRGPQSR